MRASAVIRRRWNRDSLSVERKIPIPSCGAVDMELPGVSPLVYSRFLMEYAVFLSLTDMGKDLPEYEEIPIPLSMPEEVEKEYERVESVLKSVLKNDRKAVKKILSSYLNLLTAYPDQPYGHKPIYHPIDGHKIVEPADTVSPDTLLPKDEKVLEIVERKINAGEKVLVYTNWTRLDTQDKLKRLFLERGWRTAILPAKVKPDKREAWVDARLAEGLQVLICNLSLVETGLDLNAFTTLIFYDTGYKLFTLQTTEIIDLRGIHMEADARRSMLTLTSTNQEIAIQTSIVRLAKENGDFRKAEATLDYMPPCEHETGRHEKVKLTAYEFSFDASVNYGGSEGIYIDCYLRGKFDESGRSVLHVGTLKTLRRDLEALQIMGELCGTLTFYVDRYVNQNLHRLHAQRSVGAGV